MPRFRFILPLALLALLTAAAGAKVPESAFNRDPYPAEPGPVQVFILSGQSNMEGQAALRTLEYLVYNEETAREYEHLKDRWGDWVPRNDVWVWTTNGERHGSLVPGFGASEKKMGPELGFGWTVGPALDRQVLLIKTCWGGKSVKRDFLSPSSEMPSEEQLQEELDRARKKKPETTMEDIKARYGFYYRAMIEHVRDVLGRLPELFPTYDKDKGYELAGFVFFQGWNDMVDGKQRETGYAQYAPRLAAMVRDVRKDLEAPDLPAVIGELGAGGPGAHPEFSAAQKKAAEMLDRAVFVPTGRFWEPEVEKMVNEGVWKGPDWPRFYNIGSERGYHYLGSGRIYYKMGQAFGEAMLGLLEKN
jgi:alpha-galactosidase